MGLMEWIRKKLQVNIQFKIEYQEIKMPKTGECIIFKFPKGTPRSIIDQFDQRLVEFQNTERKFISTDMEIKIVKISKKDMEVEHANSDTVEGPEGSERTGPSESRDLKPDRG